MLTSRRAAAGQTLRSSAKREGTTAFVTYNAHDLAPGGNAQGYVAEFGGAFSAGYHLVGVKLPDEPNKKVFFKKLSGNVCVQVKPLPWEAASWPAWNLDAIEHFYQECVHALSNPITCVQTVALDDSVPLPEPYNTESFNCAVSVGDAVGAPQLALPDGSFRKTWAAPLSSPITITLGAKPWAIDEYVNLDIALPAGGPP